MRRQAIKLPQSVGERNNNIYKLSSYEDQRHAITGVRSRDYEDEQQQHQQQQECSNNKSNNANFNNRNEQQKEENDGYEGNNEMKLENLVGNPPEKVFEAIITCIKNDNSKTLKDILYSITRPKLLNQNNNKKIILEDKNGRTPLWYVYVYDVYTYY